MNIEAMTNADLVALAKKVDDECVRRLRDASAPMAIYDRRERSIPDRLADLEKRIAALENGVG